MVITINIVVTVVRTVAAMIERVNPVKSPMFMLVDRDNRILRYHSTAWLSTSLYSLRRQFQANLKTRIIEREFGLHESLSDEVVQLLNEYIVTDGVRYVYTDIYGEISYAEEWNQLLNHLYSQCNVVAVETITTSLISSLKEVNPYTNAQYVTRKLLRHEYTTGPTIDWTEEYAEHEEDYLNEDIEYDDSLDDNSFLYS